MTLLPESLADRYRRFKYRHFAPNMAHFEDLAARGQRPEVMVVSCSDSRVDPETIFSAMPGELFVVRNVANLVPPCETTGTYHGVSAALEFAALSLAVKHIVVMGHSGCGGIRAALEGEAVRQSDARFLSNWMSIIDACRDRVVAAAPGAAPAELRAALEHEAIRASLSNLRSFACVADLEARGRLQLHGTLFDIASGTLSVLHPHTGAFVAL